MSLLYRLLHSVCLRSSAYSRSLVLVEKGYIFPKVPAFLLKNGLLCLIKQPCASRSLTLSRQVCVVVIYDVEFPPL